MLEKLKGFFTFDEIIEVEGPQSTLIGKPGMPRIIEEARVVKSEPVGSSGTAIYSGYFNEEYLQTLTGKQAADTYDKMRRGDSRVKMILSAVKNPIKGATWEVQPCEDMGAEGEKHADLIKHILFCDLDKPWKEKIGEFLTLVDFGHSVFEVVHKVVFDHPEFGTYNGIEALGFRSQRTINTWKLDKNGKLLSIEQLAYGDVERSVHIPGQNLLVLTLDKEGDNYEGISALRACYGAWYRKQVDLKLMAIGIERNAVPTPAVEYPSTEANSAAYGALKEHLKALTSHQQNYIMYPSGYKIDFSQNDFTIDGVKAAIQFENEEMSYALLQNFLLLGTGGSSGGSYALSFDLSDFFLTGVEHVADLVAQAINKHIIPSLIKQNFGPQKKYPELKCSGISDKAGKEFGELLKMLSDGKLITPDNVLEANIRKRLGLPEMSEDGQRQGGLNPLAPQDPNAPQPKPGDKKVPDPEIDPKAKDDEDDAEADKALNKKLSEKYAKLFQ